MKKIPTLFVREYNIDGSFTLKHQFSDPAFAYMIDDFIPTYKWDGTAVYYDGKKWYKRYDAKQGKKPPEGSIACQEEPDPITTHWPHWAPVKDCPEDRWINEAIQDFHDHWAHTGISCIGSYEAIGPKIQGNPYNLTRHVLKKHGELVLEDFPLDYEDMKEYFRIHHLEGVVFWFEGKPVAKIKSSDFGYQWP